MKKKIRFDPIYKNRAAARIELGNKKGAVEDFSMYLEQCPNAPDKNNVQEKIEDLSA